jgi:hypothetical protein
VTAGVGKFNATYVQSFLSNLTDSQPGYDYEIVQFNWLALAYNLVGNSMQTSNVAPIAEECKTTVCDSYLLTGGLQSTTPWPATTHHEAPMINIDAAPGIQVEFQRGLQDGHVFVENECTVYGVDGMLIGIRMCIAESSSKKGIFLAGLSTSPS